MNAPSLDELKKKIKAAGYVQGEWALAAIALFLVAYWVVMTGWCDQKTETPSNPAATDALEELQSASPTQ